MADPKDHTPAYKLFHYYFQCYIPQHYLIVNDFNTEFGIPTSGNREVDRNLANSPVRCQMTIAEMAEKFDQGANITLVEQRDAVRMYEIIYAHLMDWKKETDFGVSRIDAPLDDLRKFDKFAAEVYRLGKGFMQDMPVMGGLAAKVRRMGGSRPISRRVAAPREERVPEEHKSLAEDIVKENYRRTNRFR